MRGIDAIIERAAAMRDAAVQRRARAETAYERSRAKRRARKARLARTRTKNARRDVRGRILCRYERRWTPTMVENYLSQCARAARRDTGDAFLCGFAR